MKSPFERVFHNAFGKLIGKPAWHVKPGYGSFLTLEFGRPSLQVREPIAPKRSVSPKVRRGLERRHVYVRGEWHLWIYCCDWQARLNGKLVGDSMSKRRIKRAADCLDGQKLIKAGLDKRGTGLVLDFDLGGQLLTRPYDRGSEQWLLYQPSGRVLVVRADRVYSHELGTSKPSDKEWRHL